MPEKNSSTTFDPVLDTPVWGAAAIGEVIHRTERQTYHLLEAGHLDADKIGKCWRSSIRRLLAPQRPAQAAE